MRRFLFLLLALAAPASAQQPSADSLAKLREVARDAEAEAERLARWLAPVEWASGSGSECDEIVGRFCLNYDDGRPPDPPPEPVGVIDARRAAIEALRLSFTWFADDLETAAPLVRYLVEDGRAREAVASARTFAALSRDSVWGPLLIGFALHGNGEAEEAEASFREAVARMSPAARDSFTDPYWLLSDDDRRLWRALPRDARDTAAARLWSIADPLHVTPGNERWNGHIARRVWSRMLAMAPRVRDMMRWDDDLEQLTIRYGTPAGRSRQQVAYRNETSIVEHFDPDQLAFLPAGALAHGLPPAPDPGAPWPLEEPRAREGFALPAMPRLAELQHQATRFPSPEGTTLRIDAIVPLDSLPEGAEPAATLFLLDRGRPGRRSEAEVRTATDTARIFLEAPLGSGDGYSLEVIDAETQRAWRARWSLDSAMVRSAPWLSDPLITKPFEGDPPIMRGDARLVPHGSLRFERGEVVGVYAEIADATEDETFDVELALHPVDRPSALARAVGWVGRTLGLSSERVPTRLRWTAGAQVLAFDVPLNVDRDGLYDLVLRVRGVAGEVETVRRIRIER